MAHAPGLVQLRAHTRAPRHQAIPSANDALNDCGAILEDLHDFSNRMTTYRFEVALEELPRLRRRLLDAGFSFEKDPERERAPEPDDEGFVRATLQLSFPDEDGNRRNPNPDRG